MSLQGAEEEDGNIVYYRFGRLRVAKAFCRQCGMHLFNKPIPPGEVAGETAEEAADRARRQKILSINLRCLNFDSLDERVYPGMPQIKRYEGWNILQPAYVNP